MRDGSRDPAPAAGGIMVTAPLRGPRASPSPSVQSSIGFSALDAFEVDIGMTISTTSRSSTCAPGSLYATLRPADLGRRSVRQAQDTDLGRGRAVPLCLLTPDMQNRRILSTIFRSVTVRPSRQLRPIRSSRSVPVRGRPLVDVMPHTSACLRRARGHAGD
jgi:hypothetical protein